MFDFLSQKFSLLFSQLEGSKKLTESNIQEAIYQVEQALLEADVPYGVVQSFIQQIKNEVVGQKITAQLKPAEQLMSIVHSKIIEFFGGSNASFEFSPSATIMVMGLQGAGKTTTIGKLAYQYKKELQKKNISAKIVLGSIDFYRPAAIDQLEILAKKIGVDFYRTQSTNPTIAAKEILSYAHQNGYGIILLDTAGRLHIDNAMLQELQEVDALINPSHKILVLDGMTGQESLPVAQVFNDTIGFHGAILTKMDSDTRGGAAFAFRYVLKKPIMFFGEGEKMTDLSLFYPERVAERVLGMGDVQTLLEKAQEKIALDEQEKAEKALKSGAFTLQDFADQMAMMNKMGSLSQLLKYMPNMGMKISPEMIQRGEVELVKFKAIISSMTQKERLNTAILNESRMKRVALGAGVEVQDIAMLLKRFEEAKQYVKLLNKFGSV